MVTRISNNRRTVRERTERLGKCSVDRKLRTFDNDIDELDTENFEESFNIDEMAKPHTWGVTYRDKYNKIKQHVIDAPDAYDAKMKARKELGIKFSDIDDAEMIENLEEDTDSQNYMTVGKFLPKLVQTQNFVLVSVQNEADILFKGKVQGSVDNSVSNINVYYFGAWDDKTIAFYVDENDVEN